jgi:hypothetical protein
MNLLREVILVSNFFNLMELGFDPIDMFFFIDQYMFQKLPAGVIARVQAALECRLSRLRAHPLPTQGHSRAAV